MTHLNKLTELLSESLTSKIALGCVAAFSSLYMFSNYLHPWLNTTKQGFNGNTTAEQVVKGLNLKGKVIVITGSNTGIGKETARVLVSQGAHVVLCARDEKKLKKTKEEIEKEYKEAKVDAIPLDLGDKESVKNFVEKFESLKLDLHVLILNADHQVILTKDGFESHMGINHFGHHRLTMQLLPFMKNTKGDRRIVVLTSDLYNYVKEIRFEDIQMTKEKSYGGMNPKYSHSKLANVLFAYELNEKLNNDKIDIQVNSVHPGLIQTESVEGGFLATLMRSMLYIPLRAFMGKTIAQGAATSVYAAVHPSMQGIGGKFLSNCSVTTYSSAVTAEAAQKLWKLTESVTEEKYPF